MGAGLLAVKIGFILFIKSYQFPLQINTIEREREREREKERWRKCDREAKRVRQADMGHKHRARHNTKPKREAEYETILAFAMRTFLAYLLPM